MRRLIYLIGCCLLLSMSVLSQSRVLTGTVTNKNGDPIPFATVEIKGTSAATTSGEDGKFSVNVIWS